MSLLYYNYLTRRSWDRRARAYGLAVRNHAATLSPVPPSPHDIISDTVLHIARLRSARRLSPRPYRAYLSDRVLSRYHAARVMHCRLRAATKVRSVKRAAQKNIGGYRFERYFHLYSVRSDISKLGNATSAYRFGDGSELHDCLDCSRATESAGL